MISDKSFSIAIEPKTLSCKITDLQQKHPINFQSSWSPLSWHQSTTLELDNAGSLISATLTSVMHWRVEVDLLYDQRLSRDVFSARLHIVLTTFRFLVIWRSSLKEAGFQSRVFWRKEPLPLSLSLPHALCNGCCPTWRIVYSFARSKYTLHDSEKRLKFFFFCEFSKQSLSDMCLISKKLHFLLLKKYYNLYIINYNLIVRQKLKVWFFYLRV